MNKIDISVLLCTYNRAAYLEDILERLITQESMGEFRFEIVVVDNRSTDETKSVVQGIVDRSQVQVRYVFEPREGVHQARNRSMREGIGRWFAFIDDDELPEPTWLAELYSAAQATGARVLGGSVRLALTEKQLSSLGQECRNSLRERGGVRLGYGIAPFRRGVFPGTDNLLVDRDVIEEIGGFDETMIMGGADFDLMIRAQKAGFDPWYVPDAIVQHRVPPNRLTNEFLRFDSFQSGVMLALLRHRYHGSISMIAEMVARIGQTVIVTLPLMGRASLSNDHSDLLDRRIKWWRTIGYVRYALLLTIPGLPSNQSFLRNLDFRKGRTAFTVEPEAASDEDTSS